MRILTCIIFALTGLTVPVAVAADEQVETHRFAFSPGSTVRVATYTGGIRVMPTDASEVRVVVTKIPAVMQPADVGRWLEQVEVQVRQDAQGVSVDTHYHGTSVHLTFADRPQGALRIELYVPRRCQLDLQTRDGSIDIGPELVGDVRVRVESGNIALGHIEGRVDASIAAGDIQLSRAMGEVSLQARRGSLSVGTLFGPATLRTASGDIEVLCARGGLEATAVAGDLKAGFPRDVSAASRLSADGGNIIVSVDPAAAITIDARASIWGRVTMQGLPPSASSRGKTSRRVLQPLNAGGPLLKCRASGGHVTIQGEPELLAAF